MTSLQLSVYLAGFNKIRRQRALGFYLASCDQVTQRQRSVGSATDCGGEQSDIYTLFDRQSIRCYYYGLPVCKQICLEKACLIWIGFMAYVCMRALRMYFLRDTFQ